MGATSISGTVPEKPEDRKEQTHLGGVGIRATKFSFLCVCMCAGSHVYAWKPEDATLMVGILLTHPPVSLSLRLTFS